MATTKKENDKSRAKTCFVICPIGKPHSNERKHSDMVLEYIVRPAFEPLGIQAQRADESAGAEMITDRIIQSIMDSDICVADLTGLNPNVLYEIGVRHASSKPCIHIAQEGTHLPFDVTQFNTIFFDVSDVQSHRRTLSEIRRHAEAALDPKRKLSNPVTHALGVAKLLASGDDSSQLTANALAEMGEIKRRVSSLEAAAIRQPTVAYGGLSGTTTWAPTGIASILPNPTVEPRLGLFQNSNAFANTILDSIAKDKAKGE